MRLAMSEARSRSEYSTRVYKTHSSGVKKMGILATICQIMQKTGVISGKLYQ